MLFGGSNLAEMLASIKNHLKAWLTHKNLPQTTTQQLQSLSLADTGNGVSASPRGDAETPLAEQSKSNNLAPNLEGSSITSKVEITLPALSHPKDREQTPSKPVSLKSVAAGLIEQLLNNAYDGLKKDEFRLIQAYEILLSKELHGDATIQNVVAKDGSQRRSQMYKIIQKGLDRTERDAAKKKNIASAFRQANQVKDAIAAGLKPSSQATLVWTALTGSLPLIINASEQSDKHRNGIDLVLQILRKIDILCPRVLPDRDAEQLRRELIEQLYKKLLVFLIKSACYCNKKRIVIALSDSVKLDDWDEQVKQVRDAETTLKPFFDELNSLSKADNKCLAKLHSTTPSDDKLGIEKRAGNLLRDCYKWVLQHEAYQRWCDEDERVLWIKGDPGKGKTMLLCGIIDELGVSPSMAYFFCQAAYDKTNNNATAVLRGLVWMLANQNSRLIQHIESNTSRSSESVYNDANSFFVLSRILEDMLQDLDGAILVVDALDECDTSRADLIDLIKKTSKTFHIRWLISSRNWPSIEEHLADSPCLELEIEKSVGEAVQSYITSTVAQIAEIKKYNAELKKAITEHLSTNANGTFLWVALVCTSLRNSNKRIAWEIIQDLPPTLDAVYGRMLNQVLDNMERQTLGRILATTTHVYRPVSLEEMGNIIEISEESLESMNDLVKECGSFLTIRNGIIEFVHQSAQEYIQAHLPLATEAKSIHDAIYRCSLTSMSRVLRRNIYELEDIASDIKDVVRPAPDPLVPITYCCLYWVQHLQQSERILDELSSSSILSTFLHDSYLFWLEAMSLLQTVPEATSSIHLLYSITKDTEQMLLVEFIYDARRFILYFRNTVQHFPLQIYNSLTFCPARSLVRKAYMGMLPRFVTMVIHPYPDWPALSSTFGTNIHWPQAATSDGVRIAISAQWGHFEIYDVITGSMLQSTKIGCTEIGCTDIGSADGDSRLYTREDACLGEIAFDITSTKLLFTHKGSNYAWELGVWNLQTSQIQLLKRFSTPLKLSPDGRRVAFRDVHQNENLLCIYGVDTDEKLTLSSSSEPVLSCTFSVDGSAIAIWWGSGLIEVWNLEDISTIGILRDQTSLMDAWPIALSRQGEILAIPQIYEKYGVPISVKVFDVRTAVLLWHGHATHGDQWKDCIFLRQDSILCVKGDDFIQLYNSKTGAKIGDDFATYIGNSLIISSGQQVAYITGFRVNFFDVSVNLSAHSKLFHRESIIQLTDNHIMSWNPGPDRGLEWFQVWNLDRSQTSWTASSPSTDTRWYKSSRLHSRYLAGECDERIVIFVLEGQRFRRYSSFTLLADARVRFSPDGLRIASWTRFMVHVYDIETKSLFANSASLVHGSAPWGELQWTRDGCRLLRRCENDCLIWSSESGFERLELKLGEGAFWLSPSGGILASEVRSSEVSSMEPRSHQQAQICMRIWNLNIGGVDSTIRLTERYAADVNAVEFLPCESQCVILTTQSVFLCTTSGNVLLHREHLNFFNIKIDRFLSPTVLRTTHGIITFDEEIRYGTPDEPFLSGGWIYEDNRKILRIFPEDRMRTPSIYANRRFAVRIEEGRTAVLEVSFDRKT